MPTPEKDETKDEFIERCIPIVIEEGTAKDGSQANAICNSIWEESKKEKESKALFNKGDLKMKWYEIKAKSDISEIWLYEEIGIWGVGAKEFIAELNAIKSPRINMHINCPGGEVFDGAAIYNAVKRHPAAVTSFIDGIAASIASVIALAGEKVIMAANAIYMLHNPSGLVIGTSEDMRKTADILDKVRDTMIGAYVTKSGKSDSAIKELLDLETWMNADEAKAAGFVDEIGNEMDMAACAKFIPVMAKMGFKHIPKILNGSKEMPSARDIERVLRDAGCSSRMAKTILAKGYSDDLRDEDRLIVDPLKTDAPRDVKPLSPAKVDRWMELYIRAEVAVPSNN